MIRRKNRKLELSLFFMCALLSVSVLILSASFISDKAESSSSNNIGVISVDADKNGVSSQNFISQNVLNGEISLVSDVTVKLNEGSRAAYIRIEMEFTGSESTASVLNADILAHTATTYKWENIGPYYYLMNIDDTPKIAVAGESYMFLEKINNTFSVVPAAGDSWSMSVKASQSENVSANTARDLANIMNDDVSMYKSIEFNLDAGLSVESENYIIGDTLIVSLLGVDAEDEVIITANISSVNILKVGDSYHISNITEDLVLDIKIKEKSNIKLTSAADVVGLENLGVIFNADKTRFKIMYNEGASYSSITSNIDSDLEFFYFSSVALGVGENMYDMNSTISGIGVTKNLAVLNSSDKFYVSDYKLNADIEDAANDISNNQYWYDTPISEVSLNAIMAKPNIYKADLDNAGGVDITHFGYYMTNALESDNAILSNDIDVKISGFYKRREFQMPFGGSAQIAYTFHSFFSGITATENDNKIIANILMPSSVKDVGNCAFSMHDKAVIKMPISVKVVDDKAFHNEAMTLTKPVW